MLLLRADLRAELERRVRAGYPNETCGLLVGSEQDGVIHVRRAVQARNVAGERSRERYELDPLDHMAADQEARSQGLAIVGVWHSNPDHPAVPSETDRTSAWEGWSYLILSVAARGVEGLRSWRLSGGVFQEEEVRSVSSAVIRIPTPLRSYTKGRDELAVQCATVSEALQQLGEHAPGILEHVLDPGGKLRPFVNVFLGPYDVRTLQGLETAVPEGTVLSILPAVAGGG
jgi:proteasome lid subunit RPN8/RPN11